MGRSRLRLQLLPSPKARRSIFETRKKGLLKKASELSTLCGLDVCLITYPPPLLKNEEIQPFVWSNDPARVANLIESHQLSRLGGECSRSRTYDLAWFYEDRTRKIEEELEKLRKKNQEAKYPNWDERYDSLSLEELKNLTGILTDKIHAASDLLKERKIKVTEYSNTSTYPITQENYSGSSMLGLMVDRTFEQYPLPYFDAEYYNLDYQRRLMLAAAMTMNMGASCSIGPVFNHSENGVINVNPMSYNLETTSDQEPQHIGYGLMINNPADYFPQMDAAYGEDCSRMAQHIGQELMANNPTDYYF